MPRTRKRTRKNRKNSKGGSWLFSSLFGSKPDAEQPNPTNPPKPAGSMLTQWGESTKPTVPMTKEQGAFTGAPVNQTNMEKQAAQNPPARQNAGPTAATKGGTKRRKSIRRKKRFV